MPRYQGSQLGRLQQRILSVLWDREMYGLEIQRRLRFQGIKVSASQLYPALRKLEERQAISSREEARVGANRIYYTLTTEGKELLIHSMVDVLRTFEYMVGEKFKYVLEDASRLAGIKPGNIVVDFSNPRFEGIRSKLAPLTAPGGRYYITSIDREHTPLLKEWVEYEQLQDFASVVEEKQGSISLPDGSVDMALIFVRLHEEENDWIIRELGRLLKPSGKAVIVDILAMKGNYREEFYKEFVPYHSRSGLDMDIFSSMLENNHLHITYRKENKGLITLIAQPITYE